MDIKIKGTVFSFLNLGNLYWEEWKNTTAFKKTQILLAADIQVSTK